MAIGKKKIKSILETIIVIVFLLLCGFWILGYITDSKYTYGRDAAYLSDRGYARGLRVWELEYDAFVRRYGEPVRIEYTRQGDGIMHTLAIYPKFTLNCWYHEWLPRQNTRGKEHLIRITITGDDFRFGPRRIGVGSTRAEVQKAYRKDMPLGESSLEYYQPVDEGYYGDDWCAILFRYGANDRVETMTYAIAPN